MRSLIDMAAERAPFIDQSQSLNLFIESPTIGKLSSMYMHAWKKGLKTTYYLRSRPATGIAKTTTTRVVDAVEGRLVLAREPRVLRSLPVIRSMNCQPIPEPRKECSMLLDPGMDLTLRPMRYPAFFEMYKAAIKNTWTVEEVDFSTDLTDLDRRVTPAERHLIQRLVAFFATGDSIVGNNLVLNLYQHINSPEARMYLSRQLYEEALHVQFYLTLLDNYLPDMAEREQAFAAIDNIPSIKAEGGFLLPVDRLHRGPGPAGDARRPPAVPAEPDLLRRVHRGVVLLRRIRLRLLPAFEGAAARPGDRARTGCSGTRVRTWHLRST